VPLLPFAVLPASAIFRDSPVYGIGNIASVFSDMIFHSFSSRNNILAFDSRVNEIKEILPSLEEGGVVVDCSFRRFLQLAVGALVGGRASNVRKEQGAYPPAQRRFLKAPPPLKPSHFFCGWFCAPVLVLIFTCASCGFAQRRRVALLA